MMRVGIFGGTFDPVHYGHLRAVEEVREAYSLDRVYFVPAYIPPHKQTKKITDYDFRLKMLKAAIRNNRYLRLSDMEIRRKGVSYTIDTIKAFERRFGEIYFIVGLDAFLEIDTWHRYTELFSHTNFIIMERPVKAGVNEGVRGKDIFPREVRGEITEYDRESFQHKSGKRIYIYRVTPLDISSTLIRTCIKSGKSIRYLVPSPVERIIGEKMLYLNGAI
ncbi:MAG: nicotinate-nucleotide adenylyltransferase [Syntrophorhabdaceae bacterium]|nr:nicotinate-nucleotide adenylyltransferase [Syntrophorhabdaceae bacterium]